MHIYVDVSSAVHAKAGLKRYSESLAQELDPLLGQRLRLFQNSLGKRGPLRGWEDRAVAGVRLGYRSWRAAVWLAQLGRVSMDRLLPDAELFHATEHLLLPLKHIPTVFTVHDLIFEHYPQYHKKMNHLYLRAAMPLYCKRATAIIAVSEATQSDLLNHYAIDSQRITVVPEAAASHFVPQPPDRVDAVRRRYGLPSRYVLAVGTLEPRKNLIRLVDACGSLFAQEIIDALVLVGSKGWLYEGFFRHLETLPWRDRVLLPGFVDDEDLPAVYSGALVTAQPSLYEGFGLTVLEAMACGSPVCASNVASLPEVGHDAACYFDPESTEDMACCLRRLLEDSTLRQEMRQRGLAHSARYSWRRTAEETLAVYERVIGHAR